jgi:hypothetical protein
MVVGGALAAGGSIYAANKAASSQKAAMAQASEQATTQAAADKAANERLINSANQKQANFGEMLQRNLSSGLGGVGSTMLTGPSGAQPTLLGRATLLGA